MFKYRSFSYDEMKEYSQRNRETRLSFRDWPKEIGAKVEIPTVAIDQKRELERHGFWLEKCSGGILTLRRDFFSGWIDTRSAAPQC